MVRWPFPQVGGDVSWTAPGVDTQVDEYVIYLATSAAGAGQVALGTVTKASGATTLAVAAETASAGKTHVVLYTKSSLAESTTPLALALVDITAVATNAAFTDLDLDADEVAGPHAYGRRKKNISGYSLIDPWFTPNLAP